MNDPIISSSLSNNDIIQHPRQIVQHCFADQFIRLASFFHALFCSCLTSIWFPVISAGRHPARPIPLPGPSVTRDHALATHCRPRQYLRPAAPFQPSFQTVPAQLSWWPDAASRLIVPANRGAAELLCGRVDTAVETLEHVLDAQYRSHLGIKSEAACRYNLGIAYERIGNSAKAREQFNEVLGLFPGSPYARAPPRRWNVREGNLLRNKRPALRSPKPPLPGILG